MTHCLCDWGLYAGICCNNPCVLCSECEAHSLPRLLTHLRPQCRVIAAYTVAVILYLCVVAVWLVMMGGEALEALVL